MHWLDDEHRTDSIDVDEQEEAKRRTDKWLTCVSREICVDIPDEIRLDSILSDGEFLDQGRSFERSDGWSKFERFSQFHSNSSRLADLILRCSRWLML
jgi:hypothetical protein